MDGLTLSKYKGRYDFRQGTTGRLDAVFLNYLGELVQQDPLPTVEIIYIATDTGWPTSAIETTLMDELEPGKYYYDWYIDIDHPTVTHQITYRGIIDGLRVVGEDIVTVLPRGSGVCCKRKPTIIQGTCSCRPSCSC